MVVFLGIRPSQVPEEPQPEGLDPFRDWQAACSVQSTIGNNRQMSLKLITTNFTRITHKFIFKLKQMIFAVQHSVLLPGDRHQVGVAGVSSRETKIDVEVLRDTADTATTTSDDTRVDTMIYLNRFTEQVLLQQQLLVLQQQLLQQQQLLLLLL